MKSNERIGETISRRSLLGFGCAALLEAAGLSVLAEQQQIIDLHQHTNYHGRTDEQLIAHQHSMGVTKTVLLPAGSKDGLAAGAGGNETVARLAQAYPKEFVFFANEL